MNRPADRSLRLHVDWTACDGRGLCAEILPQQIARDDWGYPRSARGDGEIVVPPGAESDAEAAVSLCPRLALSLLRRPSSP